MVNALTEGLDLARNAYKCFVEVNRRGQTALGAACSHGHGRTSALGLTFQLAALPPVAYLVVHLFGMSPVLAMGLMILALSPAGATSNMISYLCRGDLALAVTLTALSSLVTPFTIPALGQFFMSRLMGGSLRPR